MGFDNIEFSEEVNITDRKLPKNDDEWHISQDTRILYMNNVPVAMIPERYCNESIQTTCKFLSGECYCKLFYHNLKKWYKDESKIVKCDECEGIYVKGLNEWFNPINDFILSPSQIKDLERALELNIELHKYLASLTDVEK